MIVLFRVVCVLIALFLAINIFRRLRKEKPSVGDLIQTLAIVVSIILATFPNIVIQTPQALEGEPTQSVVVPTLTPAQGATIDPTTPLITTIEASETPTSSSPPTLTSTPTYIQDFEND